MCIFGFNICISICDHCLRIIMQDPRFNPAVDIATGYKTKSILCMPIKAPDGQVNTIQFEPAAIPGNFQGIYNYFTEWAL